MLHKILKGFKDFILRGNAVELAVGVVIGAAFNNLIQAIVRDLLTPLIGAFVREPNFSAMSFTINGSRFMYGDLINTLISFLLVAVAIYFFVIIPMNVFMERTYGKSKKPSIKKCPECLSDVPNEAKRCAHCSQLIVR
jgi:large conductance mechanosensitive channel